MTGGVILLVVYLVFQDGEVRTEVSPSPSSKVCSAIAAEFEAGRNNVLLPETDNPRRNGHLVTRGAWCLLAPAPERAA